VHRNFGQYGGLPQCPTFFLGRPHDLTRDELDALLDAQVKERATQRNRLGHFCQ